MQTGPFGRHSFGGRGRKRGRDELEVLAGPPPDPARLLVARLGDVDRTVAPSPSPSTAAASEDKSGGAGGTANPENVVERVEVAEAAELAGKHVGRLAGALARDLAEEGERADTVARTVAQRFVRRRPPPSHTERERQRVEYALLCTPQSC